MKLIRLADFYEIQGARERAIELLSKYKLSPGNVLAIATRYDIRPWVRNAVLEIVRQPGAGITPLDSIQMGMVFYTVKELTDKLTSFRIGLACYGPSSFRNGFLCPGRQMAHCRRSWRKMVWPHIQRLLLAGADNSLTVREIFAHILKMPYIVVKEHICKSCMEATIRHINTKAVWRLEERAIDDAVAKIENRIRTKNF